MTSKCFWCGAENKTDSDICDTCGRKLQWSVFFKALLRPSVGCLLGKQKVKCEEKIVGEHASAAVI